MAAPYLVEVRTGGELKECLREIIYDVSGEFGVYGAAKPRAVPHMTLFGPYNTNRGHEVKQAIIEVLEEFTLVPYRVSGFGRFPDNKVIYANVEPSPKLRHLRRELSRRLQPLAYNYPDYDEKRFFEFHITIAFKDIDSQFDEIWQYVNRHYDPQFEEFATRVTSLRRRKMMWEYDLVQGRVLSRSEATSAESWEKTEALLQDYDTDRFDFAPPEEPSSGLLESLSNLLPRRSS